MAQKNLLKGFSNWRNFIPAVIPITPKKAKVHHIAIKQLGIKKVVIVRHGVAEHRVVACPHADTYTIAELVSEDRMGISIRFTCKCIDCGSAVERTHPGFALGWILDIQPITTGKN